tara:strand:- start:27244 stop:28437 length:1194 start_codon:yes stop_codon:yes gene_type:complete
MIRNLFIFLFLVQMVHGDIRIESPKQDQLTSQSVIDFVATSTIDKGFLIVNGQLIPVRKKTFFPNLKLQMGRNVVDVHVLNEDLKLEPHLSRSIEIYRHLPITGASEQEICLLTDLVTDYFVPVVDGEDARLDQPILKRDLYAFLMWFFKDRSPSEMTRQYDDMANYGPYIRLFQHHPNALPLPRLGSFYPNSYVTRQAFVNLLLLLNGSTEQISTSMMVATELKLPRSVRSLVPSWKDPLVFVTRGEVLSAFFKLYNGPKLSPSTVVLIKTKRDPVFSELPFLTYVIDTANQWREALRLRMVAHQSKPAKAVIVKKPAPEPMPPLPPNPSSSISKSRVTIVLPGDSIQKIARRYYGDASKWEHLVQLNQLDIQMVTINGKLLTSVHIEPGQKLRLE